MGYFSFLGPSTRPQSNPVKIKTSRFSKVVKQRKVSKFDQVYSNISLFLAALCLFEAAVWFTTGSPETVNNAVRRSYLEVRVRSHSIICWTPVFVVDPSFLVKITVLLVESQLLALQYLHSLEASKNRLIDKHKEIDTTPQLNTDNTPNTQIDVTVRKFLVILSSPKKTKSWTH